MEDGDEWVHVGDVLPSDIDRRVWVCSIPDQDIATGAMQASTSLRRAKAYVLEIARKDFESPMLQIRWQRDAPDHWVAFISREDA